jgi:hypothetical protein
VSDGSTFDLATTNITENVTLNAIFECDATSGYYLSGDECVNTYTVMFVENDMDDVDPDPSSKTVSYGSVYGELPELQKE